MIHTVIFDRDGVLSEQIPQPPEYGTGVGGAWRLEDFRIIPAAIDAVWYTHGRGLDMFVATNQPYIAKGIMTSDVMYQMNAHLFEVLGISSENVYFCPHSKENNCACRKPKPGLLLAAAKEHGFSLDEAVMIGDRPSDILAGQNAGCAMTILIGNNDQKTRDALDAVGAKPKYICSDVSCAVRLF